MEIEYRLTTFDNPFNPFTNFSEWFYFDSVVKGYNTCAYLARFVNDSDELTDQEKIRETNRAIDEIIKYDFLNIYKRVSRNDEIKVTNNLFA